MSPGRTRPEGVPDLSERVAVVAGASRGAGRGIALALGDAGATVYVLGRTSRSGPGRADGISGTVEDTADEVSARGGRGIPCLADCTVEQDVAGVFDRVREEQGRLDVLANAVYGGADAYASGQEWMAAWSRPFWEQPASLWDHMMDAGPKAYAIASRHAARLMVPAGRGLIVGITDGHMEGADPDSYGGQLIWDLSHRAIDRLMHGMKHELASKGVAVVTLMPGFMQTEVVEATLETEALRQQFRYDLSESVEYVGRAVAALAGDDGVLGQGGLRFVADLADEYGFTDLDGTQPRFNPHG